ncbi:hypothetical protein PG988_005598 [Apiospora saccharicola]
MGTFYDFLDKAAIVVVGLQSTFCVLAESKAVRWRYISSGHSLLAVAVFYPGVFLTTRGLISWADTASEKWRRKYEEAAASSDGRDHRAPSASLPCPVEKKGKEEKKASSESVHRDLWLSAVWNAFFALHLRGLYVHRLIEQEIFPHVYRALHHAIYQPYPYPTALFGVVGIFHARNTLRVARDVRDEAERPL